MWVLSDLAYADIYFDENNQPPSILQVDGAKDIAIEFQSLSKTYAMPGWRMGFAAGNKTLIAALARIKSYLDYGAYTPIQVAAAAALNGPQDCVDEIRAIYKSRRDVLVETHGARGLGHSVAAGLDVRLGADPGGVQRARLDGIRQAAADRGEDRGLARHRLRRIWRRLCAHRAGRERAAHPPGGAQCAPLPGRYRHATPKSWKRRSERAACASASRASALSGPASRKCLRGDTRALAWRAGRGIEITAISARDRKRDRGVDLARRALRTDPMALVESDDVDVVVEADRRR